MRSNRYHLKIELQSELMAICDQCEKLGYHPKDFRSMLSSGDVVQVCKRLVMSGEIQTGLLRPVELGRPDLTVEAVMLKPKYESLFTKQDLEAARWRLEQVLCTAAL